MKSRLPKYIPPNSAYIPFLRRFTDERAADLLETQALYNRVTATFNASPWAQNDIIERVNSVIAEQVTELATLPSIPFAEALDRCQLTILSRETTLFQTPIINNWSALSLKEQVDLRRYLRAQEHFLANQDRVFNILTTTLTNIFAGFISSLPNFSQSPAHFTVPLHTCIDCNDVVDRIIGTLSKSDVFDVGIFTDLNERIYKNICRASNIIPYQETKKEFVTASDSRLRGLELIATYLHDTPFIEIFKLDIPFSIPRDTYKEHCAIFAPTGHGKTQALQSLNCAKAWIEQNRIFNQAADPHSEKSNSAYKRLNGA